MHLLLSLNCFSAGLILLRWIGLQDYFPLLLLLMWEEEGGLLSLSVLILSFNFSIHFPKVPKSQHSPSPLSLEQRHLYHLSVNGRPVVSGLSRCLLLAPHSRNPGKCTAVPWFSEGNSGYGREEQINTTRGKQNHSRGGLSFDSVVR